MVTVTLTNDFLFNLASSAGVVGQQPFKKTTIIDTIASWQLTETLNDLKEFTFTTRRDEHEKTNILMERNISVPLLTTFDGIIIEKKPLKNKVQFKAVENAWHFTRRKFKDHDKARISYTNKNWHDNLWDFRRKITILGKKFNDLSTGSDLINFPLLFHTIDPELKAHARSDGFDIMFAIIENDESTLQLHHEIESFEPSTGELWAWIEYPDIRSGQDKEFQMYFGNAAAADQQNITGTWSDYLNGFNMVQHLNASSIDSSINDNDGTDTSISYVTGKIANAANFDSVNSKIDCGSGTTIDDVFNDGWITAWFNANSDGESSVGKIFDKGTYRLIMQDENAGLVRLRFEQDWDAGVTTSQWDTAVDISLNKNIRVDIVYNDTSASNTPTLYINGVPRTVLNGLLTETTAPGTTSDSDAANSFIIGNNTAQTATFDGEIEEVRVLKSPPTTISELIKIEFANENDADSFFKIGSVQSFIQQSDIIVEDILASANRDMPILNTTPIAGLVSLWQLNGDVTDSKDDNNGTWTGSEIYSPGVFNDDKSALFDGASRIATSEADFSFGITDTFSFQLKVKTSSTSEEIILSKRIDGTAANAGYLLRMTAAGLPVVEFSNGTTEYSVTGVTAINDGEFHTIGFTFSGSSNQSGMKIYFDGIIDATGSATTMTGTITNGLNLTFGAGSAGASAFTGNLDDIRFYNTTLTGKFINRLHKMTQSDIDIIQTMFQWKLGDGKVTTIDNLISLYKLDGTVLDSKGNNDGIIFGTEVYEEGKYSNALTFDALTTKVQIPQNSTIDDIFSGGGTVSAWINANSDGETSLGRILDKNQWRLNLQDEATSLVRINFVQEFSTTNGIWQTVVDIPIETITSVIVKYDNSSISNDPTIYINGIARTVSLGTLSETSTPVGTASTDIFSPLIIGNDEAQAITFDGFIDDVRLYSDLLTDAEAKRISEATDSGIDRIRDDDIPTRLLEIDFNHKNHLECLRKISKELGVQIYFNSRDYLVFIKAKGKTIKNIFDKIKVTNPSFNLNKVGNIVNILGSESEGIQREKTFETSNTLKYDYEKTFANKSIATDESVDLIGNEVLTSIKDLKPNLTIKTTPDQFNKFDLAVGDKLKINELDQDLQGTFTIIKIVSTESNVNLSLTETTNTTVQSTGKDISTIIGDILSSVQDLNITPE